MQEKMLCNLGLSVGWDPPWKHYYHHLTEAQRREATSAPSGKGNRPRGASACPRWSGGPGGRWEWISMVAVQQKPLAPAWGGHSTCSTGGFHILWVKALSVPQPREGNRRGVIMPISQARKLSPGSGRDWPSSPHTEWVAE